MWPRAEKVKIGHCREVLSADSGGAPWTGVRKPHPIKYFYQKRKVKTKSEEGIMKRHRQKGQTEDINPSPRIPIYSRSSVGRFISAGRNILGKKDHREGRCPL